MESVWVILMAVGAPSAVMSLGFWAIKRSIEKHEDVREQREKDREDHQILTLKSINAVQELSEATACALRDGHCNGEVTRALEYSVKIKREQKEFLQKQGVKHLH